MMLIAAVIYGVVGFVVACRVATFVAWRFLRNAKVTYSSLYANVRDPKADQWFGGAVFGLVGGAIWPLTAIAFAARSALFAPPPDVRAERNARRVEELTRENERLDRELRAFGVER
jgi:hypothetical protein